MINLVLECIDRLHVYSSAAHFADVAGKEAGETWKSILNSLYELLGKTRVYLEIHLLPNKHTLKIPKHWNFVLLLL